ncbi:MAG TPA: hypothetical protein PLC65_11210 [Bacteroidia bacterium]|nr:hypothetical protein [Bacteroidia bacterium]
MKLLLKHTAVIVCLLPLLFLNIKSTHDWGDDFAQYLLEAKNISNGDPINTSGFVENPNYILGPNCYPPGLPLLIALTSENITWLNVLMSFFLVCIGYFSFLLLNKWFHFTPALILSLVVVYNPLCLNFKNEVLSDLPFAALSLLFFVLYLSDNKKKWVLVLCGFILAFAVNTRYVGWVLFFALLAEIGFKLAVKYFKNHKKDKEYLIQQAWIIISFFVFHALFYLIFPQKIIYYDNPKVLSFFERISVNANYNYAVLKYFFSCFDEGFLNYVVSYGIVFTSLVGIILFVFKPDTRKPEILLFFLLGYVLSILIHQYSDTGFRLLIPIIPLILFFATYALFIVLVIIPYKQYIVFSLGLLVLFCYNKMPLKFCFQKTKYRDPTLFRQKKRLTS